MNPKLAVCITMYNETESELKHTLSGIMQNYNCFKFDEKTKFKKDDFLVVVVCDGYERIPNSFKKFARQKNLLNEELLLKEGFMTKDTNGNFQMKSMREILDPEVSEENLPENILHVFQVTSWDFGVNENFLKTHRINFMFAVKHRNDGKINSHKWFF